MNRIQLVFFVLVGCCAGVLDSAVSDQTDSILSRNNPNTSEHTSISVDSMNAVIKAFRAEQHKKILETGEKIKSEICNVNADRTLIKKYIKELAFLRVTIEKKWLELLYILKSEIEPDVFAMLVKGKWGCNCGDADCSCTPEKKDEGPVLPDTSLIVFNTSKLSDEIAQLQSEITKNRLDKVNLMWDFRRLIDEELCYINTDKRVIDQYVAKQSEIRTGIENKWIEVLWIIKSKVDTNLFESLVKRNWGCSDVGADCACVE